MIIYAEALFAVNQFMVVIEAMATLPEFDRLSRC